MDSVSQLIIQVGLHTHHTCQSNLPKSLETTCAISISREVFASCPCGSLPCWAVPVDPSRGPLGLHTHHTCQSNLPKSLEGTCAISISREVLASCTCGSLPCWAVPVDPSRGPHAHHTCQSTLPKSLEGTFAIFVSREVLASCTCGSLPS